MRKCSFFINFRVFSENDLKYLKKACARAYLAASAEKSQKLRFHVFALLCISRSFPHFLRKGTFLVKMTGNANFGANPPEPCSSPTFLGSGKLAFLANGHFRVFGPKSRFLVKRAVFTKNGAF